MNMQSSNSALSKPYGFAANASNEYKCKKKLLEIFAASATQGLTIEGLQPPLCFVVFKHFLND